MFKLSQKGIAHIALLVILLIGLVATVFLVQKTQVFKPKAFEESPIFLGNAPMRFTQGFPQGVYVSVCRNNSGGKQGVWQVGGNTDEAAYIGYDEPHARCESDVPTTSLLFTQEVPAGAYVKLCAPNKSVAWIWQVSSSRLTADYKNSELDDNCGNGSGNSQISNTSNANSTTTQTIYSSGNASVPEVVNVNSTSECTNGQITATWNWQVKNASSVVAWVYAGSAAVYKGGGDIDMLTLTPPTIKSGGVYQLQLKAVNSSGVESDIITSNVTVVDCQGQLIVNKTSNNHYGIQSDLSNSANVPSLGQLNTLSPGWVRFVYHPNSQLPSQMLGQQTLIVFNNQSVGTFPKGSQSLSEWKIYVDNQYTPALQRMLNSFSKVNAVEIWNEENNDSSNCPDKNPNSDSYCPGIPANAYAYMLKQSAKTIKNYNSGIKVVMGGIDGPVSYVEAVKNADESVFNQVDGIGIHPYGRSPNGWCANPSASCAITLSLGSLSSYISSFRGVSGLPPIWVTEIGQGTTKPIWQGDYLQNIFTVLNQQNVEVIIWYAWTDNMGGFGEPDWGLFTSSGVLKPSGEKFRQFTN